MHARLLLIAGMLLAVTAHAQQPRVDETIEVSIISLDVVQMKDRLVANLYQLVESSGIPSEVILGRLKSDGRKRWQLPVRIRIPVKAPTTIALGAEEVGALSVYVVTGRFLGVTSEVLRRAQPFRIPRRDVERAKTSHFTDDVVVRIDEKVDRMSVGVVDERGKEFGLQRIELPPRTTTTASRR